MTVQPFPGSNEFERAYFSRTARRRIRASTQAYRKLTREHGAPENKIRQKNRGSTPARVACQVSDRGGTPGGGSPWFSTGGHCCGQDDYWREGVRRARALG